MFDSFLRRATALVAPLLATLALSAADVPAHPDFARAADIPVEHFFREPAIAAPRLNPAGTHVAMIVHELDKDARGLLFMSLADGKFTGMRGGGDYDVSNYQWAGDDRVVFSVNREKLYSWGLYAMKVEQPQRVVTLNNFDVVDVLGTPRARPDHVQVYIARSARNEGRPGGLLELDLKRDHTSRFGDSGRNIRDVIPLPPGDAVRRWFRDRTGEVRYAVAHRGAELSLHRRLPDGKWKPIPISLDRDSPLAVHADPNLLFVAHLADDGARELRTFNTDTGKLGPVLHRDEKYDFSRGSVLYSAADDEVIGLTYARQATEQVWLRDDEAALQQALDRVLPANRLNQIVSRSRDGSRLLVVSSSDRHPGSLFLFDRATMKLRRLTDFAPWLPEKFMAPVMITSFKARDGLRLDAYVTLPPGHVEGKPSPMVVLPHGGPWARDTWGYDAESQFLASRGYVVFRPNYRGSDGYNFEISILPRMEFRKMHDDVTDGVRALIAGKIADPHRIAIFGASFGGYLAVAGAAFEPDLYRCAVSFAGVFDLATMMKDDRSNRNDYRHAWFRRDFGDPKANDERFDAMSPLRHVQAIKAKIFVAHGVEDRNADSAQSRRLVKALKAAGVEHETMFISGEGHGLAAMKNRVEFFRRLEAFLKKHL